MDPDLALDTEKYVSTRRAAEMTGYAQDYIGQLARSGQIDAKRVGGLWHVSMESLLAYKNKADDFKPVPPVREMSDQSEAQAVTIEGKEYISANRASKISGYNQDYIGQLARGGKIHSHQIGNRWYIDKDTLLAHKAEKDAMLAAVQTQSVGVRPPQVPETDTRRPVYSEPLMRYTQDTSDLIPMTRGSNPRRFRRAEEDYEEYEEDADGHQEEYVASRSSAVSIRRMSKNEARAVEKSSKKASGMRVRIADKAIYKAILWTLVLFAVAALSVAGYRISRDRLLATDVAPASIDSAIELENMTAGEKFSLYFDIAILKLEEIVTKELVYERAQ